MLYGIKNYLFKKYLMYSKEVIFKNKSRINKNSIFEGKNSLGINTDFFNSYIGTGSYIANNSIIKNAKIGRFCAIGDNVRTCLGLHPTKDFVSVHPAFFSLDKQAGFTFVDKQLFEEHKYTDENSKYVVEIGNDVWIGNNVIIMDGIKISDGAIVAAGSVVTKDVEPYAIVGGVPAKLIKHRFDESDINFLLELKWWEKSIEWQKNNHEYFNSIKIFKEKNSIQ